MRKILLFTTLFLLIIVARSQTVMILHQKDKTTQEFLIRETDSVTFINPNNFIYGSVSDVDGNAYKTIKIGTQTWMAENLRTTKYRNGLSIPNLTNDDEWNADTLGAWVYYKNDTELNIPYGKLYNWNAVANINNICPVGWHVPKVEEWELLSTFIGGLVVAGGKLKSIGTQYWSSPNKGATNSSGFNAFPAGDKQKNFFSNLGLSASWWSASVDTAIYCNNNDPVYPICYDDYLFTTVYSTKSSVSSLNNFIDVFKDLSGTDRYMYKSAYSVRCVKD